ncbi:MAG: DUF3341 domain-containing protein [Terrimicrobiaceae bacterium]|nr:DUF3341 domain-containing protein [Terrimicrobiaceae bacterium]
MESSGNLQAPVYGIAAEFQSASELYHAAEKLRDAGFKRWDVFSPFPIHGMDQAMGMKQSMLGKFVFLGGLTGFLTAVSLQFITSSFIYPLIVAGKPTNFFTVPAFFPVMFELTILFSAFTAVFGMLIMNGLPRLNHPLFNWSRFAKVTEDKFFVAIESTDPNFEPVRVRELLESLGGTNVTTIHED